MIRRFSYPIPVMNRTGWIDVYLPQGYDESNERYPVLYMFDGQNLFDDAQATFGTSWGLQDFLDACHSQIIVVGIECDPVGDHRLHEYCPYALRQTFFGPVEGKGEDFFEWMIHDLKPFIDASLRTWPHREATALAGSSMGGLMAFYGLFHHNDVFSKAAALSPSLMISPEHIRGEVEQSDLHPDTRLYTSYGSEELTPALQSSALDGLDRISHAIHSQGGLAWYQLVAGGKHNEATWRMQNPAWLAALFAEPDSVEEALHSIPH